MRQSFEYRPRREDYFPTLKRGHGTTHGQSRVIDGEKVREAHLCIDPTCNLHQPKSKNLHHDAKANLTDWCEEHRLSLKYHGPTAMMIHATGGR